MQLIYGSLTFVSLFYLLMQNDKKKIQDLSCEVQRKEEWLQEERVEREKVEAELESVREQNCVSESKRSAVSAAWI